MAELNPKFFDIADPGEGKSITGIIKISGLIATAKKEPFKAL